MTVMIIILLLLLLATALLLLATIERVKDLWQFIDDLDTVVETYHENEENRMEAVKNMLYQEIHDQIEKEQKCRLKDNLNLAKRIAHFENLEAIASINRKKKKEDMTNDQK